MRFWLVLALTGSLAVPASAQPDTDRRAHSVQCMLAMSAASGVATNQTAHDAAKIGMLFFAAQLFGMDPNIDLTAAARAQMPSMTRSKVQALVAQCGSEMHARERQITDAGRGLRQGR